MSESFIALGPVLASPLLGYALLLWLEPRLRQVPGLTLFGLSIPAAFMAWGTLFTISSSTGHFDSSFWGGLGWVALFLCAVPAFTKMPFTRLFRNVLERPRLVILCLLSIWLGFAFHADGVLGGRDEGVYFNQAVHIFRSGGIKLNLPYPQLQEPEFEGLRTVLVGTGLYVRETFVVQFTPFYPSLLAQFVAIGGEQGAHLLNSLLGGLNLIIFACLLRLHVRSRFVSVGLLLFALNVPQIFMTRVTLSEMSTQTFILAYLLSVSLGIRIQSARLVYLAQTFLFGAFMVRLDTLALVPPALLASGLFTMLSTNRPKAAITARVIRKSSVLLVALMFITLLSHWLTSEPYIRFLGSMISIAVVLSTCTAIFSAWLGRTRTRKKVLKIVTGTRFWLIPATLLVLGSLHCLFVRPLEAPVYLPGVDLWSFQRDALQNLAKYLSYPAVLLAVGGAVLLGREHLRQREFHAIPLFCICLFCTIVFVYDPLVWPHQPWGSRRFQPLIIPAICLFACRGLDFLFRELRRDKKIIVEILLLCSVATHVSVLAETTIWLRGQDGASAFLAAVREELDPKTPLVLDSLNYFILPLTLADARPCVTADLADPKNLSLASKLLSDESRIQVLSDRPLNFYRQKPKVVTGGIFENSLTSDPLEIRYKTVLPRIYCYNLDTPIDPLDREVLQVGDLSMPGVKESGFYPQEWLGSDPFRWTKGEAQIVIPVTQARNFQSVEIEIARAVVPYRMKLEANGVELVNEIFSEKSWNRRIPIPPELENSKVLNIDLTTETFKPENDPRSLGVQFKMRLFR